MRKAEIRMMHSENGGRGHNVSTLGDKKDREIGFPSHPLEGTMPANTLTVAP